MTELTTNRFRLRPPSADDVGRLLAHWHDPLVGRHLWDDQLVSSERVLAVVEASVDDHERHGWGGWLICTHEPRTTIVGWCSLTKGPADRSEPSEQLVEHTYSLAPAWWHRGAAVEAASAVLDHAYAATALDAVFAGVDPPNTRSAATLRRLGFVPDREVMLDSGPTPYWRLPREHWFERRSTSGPDSSIG